LKAANSGFEAFKVPLSCHIIHFFANMLGYAEASDKEGISMPKSLKKY
jgi:hypothetical protein